MFPIKQNDKAIESDVKEWFIIIENQQLGPYSLLDLKKEPRFTPDTLVWKKGYKEWTKARFILELQKLFKDEPKPRALHEPKKSNGIESDLQQSQAALTLQQDPYQFLLWILVLLLIIFYTFYRFYYRF
jgi:hypothetical protein